MKQIMLLFWVIFIGIMPTLAQTNFNYKIEGHISGLAPTSKIYLINGGQRKIIDSAVVKNDRFVLTGSLKEPAHTYLYSGKKMKLADILLDNAVVTVSGSKPVYDSIKVSGSPIDQQWKEWYRQDQRIGYQRYRINQVAKALTTKQDTAHTAILKKLADEMMQDRINLLKSYVARYHDSAVGAALPTLCTLQDQLTKTDYLQMYQTLTLAMQNTAFGKEILSQAEKSKK